MSNNVRDLRDTIIPKSDQLNAEQLLGGPITVTVTEVRRAGSEEQPVVIHYEGEGGRPYKPCKTMRKVLVFAWGSDGSAWIGRSMTLFNRPDVKFGGEAVGGIRISHLSHIERDLSVALTSTRGRKEPTKILRLAETNTVDDSHARLKAAARGGMKSLQAAWKAIPAAHRTDIGGAEGCPDALKQVALEADARTAADEPDSEAPLVTVAGMKARFDAAKTIDELDDAYNDVSLFEASEDREALTEAYHLRRDALELA